MRAELAAAVRGSDDGNGGESDLHLKGLPGLDSVALSRSSGTHGEGVSAGSLAAVHSPRPTCERANDGDSGVDKPAVQWV